MADTGSPGKLLWMGEEILSLHMFGLYSVTSLSYPSRIDIQFFRNQVYFTGQFFVGGGSYLV